MKKLLMLISLAFLFCGFASAENATTNTNTVNPTIPTPPSIPANPTETKTKTAVEDKSLHFVDGTSIKISELKGKWILVNFWAVWCGPCQEEIPELNRLAKKYSDKIKLFGVNPEHLEKSQLVKQIGRMHIQFPVLHRESARELGVTTASVLPTTYVINPQGKMVKTLIGAQTVQTILNAIQFADADE